MLPIKPKLCAGKRQIVAFCLLILFTFPFAQAQAQTNNATDIGIDTVALKRRLDSLTRLIEGPKPISEPTKAALLSAVLPGLGQIYNKNFWYLKVPVIYAAAGALAITLNFNQRNYTGFRDAYQYRLDKNPFTTPDERFNVGNDEGIRSQRDRFRRERDYTIILSIGLYLLQIAEAATTAHLKTFDVSDQLTLHFKPSAQPLPMQSMPAMGIAIGLRIDSCR
ncbi:MAG: DUF5683 domain-containing protein [Cytophagales bacterium]|nr:DUF5683 domain-containing protein [Bernardetiaceae bacterium]MDW8203572.1 DUF5683 domain-containing protein [Cytophagales bacterium]